MAISLDGSAQRSRSFSFPLKLPYLIAIILVVALSLSGASIVPGLIFQTDQTRAKELKKENELLKERFELFSTKSQELEERLSDIERLELNLESITGVTANHKEEGKGGPEEVSFKELCSSLELAEWLDELGSEVNEREKRFLKVAQVFEKNKASLLSTPLIWPVEGKISSAYGWRKSPFTGKREFHKGVDIVNHRQTPIKATADGKVVFAGHKQGYGLSVVVSHNCGYRTVYGHLSKAKVQSGSKVKRGEVIGLLGNTGRSTGPHLHYEILVNKKQVNPWKFLVYSKG